MTIGLETLDLARIHEEALSRLASPEKAAAPREAIVHRAGTFFAEAIIPIEETHRAALRTNLHLDRVNQMLRRRGAELADSNQRLQQEILKRKSAEDSLRRSEQHYGRLLEQSRQMQEQLRRLSRQLLSAQEEERKKISRELHDVIAQTLTTINVRLAALRKEASFDAEGLERSIARTQQLVQQSVEIVHRFARELRPAVLDDLGLIPALRTLMKGFTEQTGIRVSLSAFAAIEQVNGEKRTVLYRIAQEALNNVARHAQASEAEVRIQKLPGAVRIKIIDNGRGFSEGHPAPGRRNKRLGLLGMRERAEMVGGSFTAQSVGGKGTTVMARIPLANRADTAPK